MTDTERRLLAQVTQLRRDLDDAERTIKGLRIGHEALVRERDEYRDALLGRHTVRTMQMAKTGRRVA